MTQTLDEIRRHGLEALRSRLGRAGMIRFLQQFSTGEGDYTQSRKAWVDQTSMADLGAFVDELYFSAINFSAECIPAFNLQPACECDHRE